MIESQRYDVAILGGGILGLATGLALGELSPQSSILLLEKEEQLASHQTGHNSGVLHAGIYYRPGSDKAKLCRDGVQRMRRFCEAHSIPVRDCGKLVVATDASELGRLGDLQRRAEANGVPGLRRIGAEEARELEPHARAIAAIHSPTTAIVDFARVARAMADDLRAAGVHVRTGARVQGAKRLKTETMLQTSAGEFLASSIVNCCGLHADRVAARLHAGRPVQIIPFRGEYHELNRPELLRGLVYPVPDPRLPFLGVHFTKRVDGSVEAGPNAVLALAREGYLRSDVSPSDLAEMLSYAGFWRMAAGNWRTGIYEMLRSASKRLFLRALQRLIPELEASDLRSGGSGVRAQAVAPDGSLLDDFRIEATANAIHVLNAPSPAATASLSIGRQIALLAAERLPSAH